MLDAVLKVTAESFPVGALRLRPLVISKLVVGGSGVAVETFFKNLKPLSSAFIDVEGLPYRPKNNGLFSNENDREFS